MSDQMKAATGSRIINITGFSMTLKLGLIGAGIFKSKMPLLQEYLAQLTGISLTYELFDGEGDEHFEPITQLQQLKEQGYAGANVTHPYKQQVHRFVTSSLVPGHEHIGSYNTVKFVDGLPCGANTDYTGLIRGYRYRLGEQSPGNVLLCGAGGVGRATAFALEALGVGKLGVFDINSMQASNLVTTLQSHGVAAELVTSAGFADYARDVDGLVNCTALGMYCYPGSAFPAQVIGAQQWAFDAVYTPLHTEFLIQCERAGMICLTGFDLWLFQGVDAFHHFAGVDVDVESSLVETALSWLD